MKKLSLFIFSALLITNLVACDSNKFLLCTVDGVQYTYKLIENKQKIIQNSSDEIVIQRWDETIINGFHTFKYSSSIAYEKSALEINRITGAIQFQYLNKPDKNKSEMCKKKNGFGCDDWVVSEIKQGTCNLTTKKI